MASDELTGRSLVLIVIAIVSSLSFLRGIISIWEHNFGMGFILISVAFLLTLFFGKHKIVVPYIGVMFLLVSAGMTALVGEHKVISLGAFLLLGIVFVLLTRRIAQKSP